MSDTEADLIGRARAQRTLRGHAGSFDDDFEAMDAERSPRAAWWPFIKVAVAWANVHPDWTIPDAGIRGFWDGL